MEEAQRSQASRRGHRAHLTKLLKRTEEIMANENPSEMDMAVLRSAIEQLQKKKALLQELDSKINATIEDPDELENEIIAAEDIQSDIIERICQVNKFYELKQTLPVHQPHTEASHLPAHSSHTDPQEESQLQASPQQVTLIQNAQPQQVHTQNQNAQPQQVHTQNQNVQPQQVQSLNPPPSTPHQHVNIEVPTAALNTPTTQSQSRLPKLSLPTFNGNPLQWQTFWDSFKAAVHSNSSLSAVEKFNYLKAQTGGDAARAISGFPLTNSNYEQAIALLNERFGQTYKIVNAHMQALLTIPNPTTQLTSIRQFYDTIENHTRGLSALGKS